MAERLMELLEQIAAELHMLNATLSGKSLDKIRDEDQTMFAKEAAEYLKISYDTLLRWAKEGKIPSSKPGGQRVLFRKKALDQWQAEQETKRMHKAEPEEKQYGKLRKINA